MAFDSASQHAAGQSGWHEDFYIGPPSKPIDIAGFLSAAQGVSTAAVSAASEHIEDVEGVTASCSVNSLTDELNQTLASPAVHALLNRRQSSAAQDALESHLNKIHGLPRAKSQTANDLKRKRVDDNEIDEQADEPLPSTSKEPPEVAYMREELDGLKLKMAAKLPPQAHLFIRRPRVTDQNSLQSVMDSSMRPVVREQGRPDDEPDEPDVALSIAVYTAQSLWPNGLRLSSMHDLLASNTLADLMQVIPCQSASLPHAADRRYPEVDFLDRACIGMDDVVYGRYQQDPEGIAKLMAYVDLKKPETALLRPSGVALENVRLGSLTLHMNYPYWIFHAGMCEHIWCITGIHLHHATDPDQAAYPLTTFLPPSTAPNCGICKTLPAVIAVSGDIRLGESPCLVCKACWDLLGWPNGDEEIKVVRLIGPRTVA